MSARKRKTRLKGTETHKPCVDCGELKDRFQDFKPRWAGCADHVGDNGRRVFTQGCAECLALVNGNIRQPRCVLCDRNRPKKRSGKAATPTPTPVAAVETEVAEPVVEPVAVEPEPVEPEPVVVAQPEPSPESEDVTPAPADPSPTVTNMADLLALLDDDSTEADW